LPDDPTNLNALAWVDVAIGDFGAARALADRAVVMAPDAGAFHGTRCFALVGLGERQEAHVECATAVALPPEHLTYLGMIAFLDNRYEGGDTITPWARSASAAPRPPR
jgi:Flp pilus assembly protein TadD